MGATLEEAYRKYAEDLIRFATGLVGPTDAPDVVSAVTLRLATGTAWSRVEDAKPYLFRAVLNEARGHHRSTMRRRAREERVAVREVGYEVEIRPEVLEQVSVLSVRQRSVVVLTYWHDLDQRGIAELLGVSEGSVRRHLARALARLRSVITDV